MKEKAKEKIAQIIDKKTGDNNEKTKKNKRKMSHQDKLGFFHFLERNISKHQKNNNDNNGKDNDNNGKDNDNKNINEDVSSDEKTSTNHNNDSNLKKGETRGNIIKTTITITITLIAMPLTITTIIIAITITAIMIVIITLITKILILIIITIMPLRKTMNQKLRTLCLTL